MNLLVDPFFSRKEGLDITPRKGEVPFSRKYIHTIFKEKTFTYTVGTLVLAAVLIISGCVSQTNVDVRINVTTNLTDVGAELGGFCGASTNGACSSDSDCIVSGCSGEICQSANEESRITTCEYRECYNKDAFGMSCGCVNAKCAWRN